MSKSLKNYTTYDLKPLIGHSFKIEIGKDNPRNVEEIVKGVLIKFEPSPNSVPPELISNITVEIDGVERTFDVVDDVLTFIKINSLINYSK